MLRTTIACAGAALGGADAVTVLPYTWALGRPDAFARRIARNTHLVLQEESSLGRVADPAHGAWLDREDDGRAGAQELELFQDIEAKGGMGAALESGFIQDEIARTAEARAGGIATGRQELTGVSTFPRLADDGVKVASTLRPSRSSRAAPRLRRCRCGALPSRSKRCATPQTRHLAATASARRCSWPASASLPPTRLAPPGRGTSSPPAHRGHRRRRPPQLDRCRQGFRRQRGASRLHLLVRRRLCRAGGGHCGALKPPERARCCWPGGRRRRKPRCRRRAWIPSFLLVATRLQPLRVSMMH